MFNKITEEIKNYARAYTSAFLVFCVVSFLGLFFFWIWLSHSAGIDGVKTEIKKLQTSFNASGYDIAYDNVDIDYFSISNAVVFKNVKIYKLASTGYFEWNIPELIVNPGFFNAGKITLKLSPKQLLKTDDDKTFNVSVPDAKIILGFNEQGLAKAETNIKNINIENIAKIDELKLAAQRMAPQQTNELTPFFENHIDIKGITFSDELNAKAPKRIEKLYLNANLIGAIKFARTYGESLKVWQKLGGMVDVKKLILHWEPINMVAKGELYFNDKFEPTLQLNTSSKGMIEMLDTMQEAEILDSKGVFVVKILLNNKGFYLSEGDEVKTVTTPLSINKRDITLENISIKAF